MVDNEVAKINGMFVHEHEGKPSRILIKKSYIENDPLARFYFQDLLAEEAAHVLAKKALVPLNTLPPTSLALFPFENKEALLEALSKQKQEFYGGGELSTSTIDEFMGGLSEAQIQAFAQATSHSMMEFGLRQLYQKR